MDKLKVAETTFQTHKINIFITETRGIYQLTAYHTNGAQVNHIPTMEQIILGALYNKSLAWEDYQMVLEKRASRWAGLMGEDTREPKPPSEITLDPPETTNEKLDKTYYARDIGEGGDCGWD